jgi:hypothetical protein
VFVVLQLAILHNAKGVQLLQSIPILLLSG